MTNQTAVPVLVIEKFSQQFSYTSDAYYSGFGMFHVFHIRC